MLPLAFVCQQVCFFATRKTVSVRSRYLITLSKICIRKNNHFEKRNVTPRRKRRRTFQLRKHLPFLQGRICALSDCQMQHSEGLSHRSLSEYQPLPCTCFFIVTRKVEEQGGSHERHVFYFVYRPEDGFLDLAAMGSHVVSGHWRYWSPATFAWGVLEMVSTRRKVHSWLASLGATRRIRKPRHLSLAGLIPPPEAMILPVLPSSKPPRGRSGAAGRSAGGSSGVGDTEAGPSQETGKYEGHFMEMLPTKDEHNRNTTERRFYVVHQDSRAELAAVGRVGADGIYR
mmetsp:Transcript_33477/g.79415  ORF Transcript_33477/g.79415 Transcript_33477/m.79415 type:complete len:286 (+) Transcript_33477:2-859(+)